jgi:ATPase subunit of ABC transporter with duplicated ATPase domains
MLQKPNVLVLDELTNHLDLESINALNVALQKFEGTVLLVTHDQDVMEEVGTRVWHFDRDVTHRAHRAHGSHGGIHDFKGTYEEFAASVA